MNEVNYRMDEKRRREFIIYRKVAHQTIDQVGHGVIYDEGNVQVLYREDVGHVAEQYANISQVFGIMEGANVIEIVDE